MDAAFGRITHEKTRRLAGLSFLAGVDQMVPMFFSAVARPSWLTPGMASVSS
jgi:hypothetical protein